MYTIITTTSVHSVQPKAQLVRMRHGRQCYLITGQQTSLTTDGQKMSEPATQMTNLLIGVTNICYQPNTDN